MHATDLPDGMKMEGSGVVAQRTNDIIAVLVTEMDAQGVTVINRAAIEDVVLKVLTNVGTEETARQYARRVVDHGPFERTGVGVWTLTPEGVEVGAER